MSRPRRRPPSGTEYDGIEDGDRDRRARPPSPVASCCAGSRESWHSAPCRIAGGRIQLFAPGKVTPDFDGVLLTLSLGDWIGVSGEIMKTRKGELSVKVEEWVDAGRGQTPVSRQISTASVTRTCGTASGTWTCGSLRRAGTCLSCGPEAGVADQTVAGGPRFHGGRDPHVPPDPRWCAGSGRSPPITTPLTRSSSSASRRSCT